MSGRFCICHSGYWVQDWTLNHQFYIATTIHSVVCSSLNCLAGGKSLNQLYFLENKILQNLCPKCSLLRTCPFKTGAVTAIKLRAAHRIKGPKDYLQKVDYSFLLEPGKQIQEHGVYSYEGLRKCWWFDATPFSM